MINIDDDILRLKYQEIERTCYENGELVPFLFDRTLPEEYGGFDKKYRLSEEDIMMIYDNLSSAFKDKLMNNRFERLKICYDFADGDFESYYDDELSQFLMKYPQFYDIVVW